MLGVWRGSSPFVWILSLGCNRPIPLSYTGFYIYNFSGLFALGKADKVACGGGNIRATTVADRLWELAKEMVIVVEIWDRLREYLVLMVGYSDHEFTTAAETNLFGIDAEICL